MDQEPATLTSARQAQESDARLAARLKQLLHTPGISDKDRKLVERNLLRLVAALERRKAEAGDNA